MGMFDEAVSLLVPKEKVTTANAFWSKDSPVITKERKILTGGMWAYQKQWWELENFIKVFVGGYGSGKTLIGCKRIIASALENAPVPVAAVSPNFPMARQTTIATLKELLAGKKTLYKKHFDWNYNASAKRFTIKYNGRVATIFIYSGDNPDTLKGSNLAAAYMDEAFLQDEGVFKQMLARVRHPNAVKPEILITGTPEGIGGWGYEVCEGPERDKHNLGIIHASTQDNLALDPAYCQRLLESYDPKMAMAYIQGQFVNLFGGLVYHAFDKEKNVKALDIPPDAELGCGMDFNVNPFAFVVFWRKSDHIHIFAEYELPNADTEFACSQLYEHYGSRLKLIYPDASGSARKTSAPQGRSDYWYLERNGYNIRAKNANPFVKDRINAVNGKFRSTSGNSKLTIAPTCVKLIKYLQSYTYEGKHKKEQEAFSHLLDALGYPIAYLYPVDKNSLVSTMKITGF